MAAGVARAAAAWVSLIPVAEMVTGQAFSQRLPRHAALAALAHAESKGREGELPALVRFVQGLLAPLQLCDNAARESGAARQSLMGKEDIEDDLADMANGVSEAAAEHLPT